MFTSIDPFTEKQFRSCPFLTFEELENKLKFSVSASKIWAPLPLEKKIQFVENLKINLLQKKKELAQLITKEVGKPITQSLGEIEKCATLCDYVAEQAPQFLSDQKFFQNPEDQAYVTYQPLGTILGIMPWNFPFWQVLRFSLPALVGGNSVLVKQAPNVGLCGHELEKLFTEFPKGCYQDIPISVEQVENIIEDSRIQGVSLTGSVKAGKAVAQLSGKHLKKLVLELGGSDPYIILDSADLKQAARECVKARMNNAGQSCIAAKRLIVTSKNAASFSSLIQEEMQKYKIGDPHLKETKLGPLARKDLRDELHNQVSYLVDQGAEVLCGAYIPPQKGYFYPPSVLRVKTPSPLTRFEGELFGPVALIFVVSSEEEALELANNSSYGLGAAVFSKDIKKAEKWARNLVQAGSCTVNGALHSHPALPFGGTKNSGYGRELSQWGFYEFVNIKTIRIHKES